MAMREHITLRELQRAIKRTLEGDFTAPVWVSAEISDLKLNQSGHCYLELIEKGEGSVAATAQARAVIWRSAYQRIATNFSVESGCELVRGVRILARVEVSYHELYGLSLQIVDIDPAYTMGDMERQRQQTISQLKADGVWDMNRELRLEPIVQRIAVISSATAAGYQDFMQEISRSPYRFQITLFDALMQGDAAEESIVDALCRIDGEDTIFDAVVVIRGGGSRGDLSCFDSYRLSSYIAQASLPVITGIGHDKDTSVVDMVAHTALKTPTAVAVWLTERTAQVDAHLDSVALQLRDATIGALAKVERKLQTTAAEIKRLSGELLLSKSAELKRSEELLRLLSLETLKEEQQKLQNASDIVEGYSPERLFALGYAVARSNGAALRSVEGVQCGTELDILLADGELTTTIKRVKKWQKRS